MTATSLIFGIICALLALWLAGTNTAVGRWLSDLRHDIDGAVDEVRDELAEAISDMHTRIESVPGVAAQRVQDLQDMVTELHRKLTDKSAEIETLKLETRTLDGVVSDHSDALADAEAKQNSAHAVALESEVAVRHQQTQSLANALDAVNARLIALEQATQAQQLAEPEPAAPD